MHIEKGGGKQNKADAFTKSVDPKDFALHTNDIVLDMRMGRRFEAQQMAGEERINRARWADEGEDVGGLTPH